jgi:hypothetical protein
MYWVMMQVLISRGLRHPVRWCGELTVPEILSDPIVQAVMEADRVDPRALEVQLQTIANQLSAVQHAGPKPLACRAP